MIRIVCCAFVLVPFTLEPPYLDLHPPSLPIFPGPFKSYFYHKPSWVLQPTKALPLPHSYYIRLSAGTPPPSLNCPGIPHRPGTATLLFIHPPSSFASVTSLRICIWPSALFSQFLLSDASYSLTASTISSPQQTHKSRPSKVCPLSKAPEPNFQLPTKYFQWALLPSPSHQVEPWLPRWYPHPSPQSHRLENAKI